MSRVTLRMCDDDHVTTDLLSPRLIGGVASALRMTNMPGRAMRHSFGRGLHPGQAAGSLIRAVGAAPMLLALLIFPSEMGYSDTCTLGLGLIAHWRLDGNAIDSSGNGHHGTVYGATPEFDRFGNAFGAMRFDGSSRIDVPDDPDFTLGLNPFTIATWMQFSQPGTYYMMGHDEGQGNQAKWIFLPTSAGIFFLVNGPSTGGFTPVAFNGWNPQVNTWYHLAVRRDGAVFTLFVDGVQVAQGTEVRAIPDPNALLQLGTAEPGHPERVFRGLLDDVRIYDHALSDDEMASLHLSGDLLEVCNSLDDDCDGSIDEGCDDDNDGYCDSTMTVVGSTPACPSGAGDCDDGNSGVWAAPGEVLDLEFATPLEGPELRWTAPAIPGSTTLVYDVLRAEAAYDFLTNTTCVEFDDGPNTFALDVDVPLPGEVSYYLVRPENQCPGALGIGPLGFSSSGVPVTGRQCP